MNKIVYLLGGLSAFFISIQTYMIAIGVLIIIDLLMGVLAAKKRGEKISSKKLSNTIIKMLVYQLLIISAQIVQVYLLPEWLPVMGITLAFLGIVEIFSIGESFTVITGKNFIKFLKTYIMKKLKSNDLPNIEDFTDKKKK